MLIHRYNYPTCSKQTVNGSRVYLTPTGEKLPSVTTILSATTPVEKLQSLQNWRRAVGEKQAQAITTEAASRGTRMHSYLEHYIKGTELKESVSNPYAQQSLVMAKTVIKQGFKNISEIWGNEVPLYYSGLYAGTADAVGLHLDFPSLLDFKQTNKPKREEYIEDYYLQLTAYALAHNSMFQTNIRRGVVLMCVKPTELDNNQWTDPICQEFLLTEDRFDYWTERWWERVETYYAKR